MAADPAVAELIREVLAEELAHLRAGVREERVRIANDADLAAFAKRVLAMANDRGAREAFEKGNLVFRLEGNAGGAGSTGGAGNTGGTGNTAGGTPSGRTGGARSRGVREAAVRTASAPRAATAQGPADHTEVIERGLLSERHVDRLPRETARVRLGPHVRMTPLARDRLRRRGITIERTE